MILVILCIAIAITLFSIAFADGWQLAIMSGVVALLAGAGTYVWALQAMGRR